MPDYVFDLPPPAWLPVHGSAKRVAIGRIFCVGRNYEDHAKEMGFAGVDRQKPFYFTKSPHALVQDGGVSPYPPGTANYHFEMELVVVIGASAFRVSVADALACVYGYACGLDMTRRDLQLAERAHQRPWDLGKDVEHSAPVSAVAPASVIGHPDHGRIELRQNGVTRQDADLSQLVWKTPEIIAHLSQFYHLRPGDLIFTGTPAGVGPVEPGDVLEGSIAGVGALTATIGPKD